MSGVTNLSKKVLPKLKKVATKKSGVVSARPKKPKKDKTVSKVRTAPKPKVTKRKRLSHLFSLKRLNSNGKIELLQ